MSDLATDAVWNLSKSCRGSRLVLLAMARKADYQGQVSLSLEEISQMTRLTVRGISKCIAELQSLGEISRTTGGGSRNPNKYSILLIPSAGKGSKAPQARSRNTVPGTVSKDQSSNNRAPEQGSWNSGESKTEPGSIREEVSNTPFGSITNKKLASSADCAPGVTGGSSVAVPAGARQLVVELERAGIVVGWRLTAAEWQRVTALSARWGTSRLVEVIARRWDPKRPPQSARYLLRVWDDLPSALPKSADPSNVVQLGQSRGWTTYRDSTASAYQNGF